MNSMEPGHGKKKKGGRQNVPWHITSLPRPQEQYNIKVNNSNQPFEHVWLERSEDGSRFVHPMEKLSVLDFVEDHVTESVPVTFCPIENTPFKLVEGVKELRELATKLRNVNEFAVDLEHNQYRSFQGLTCLMQISTRTEDFVIDTLKLRVHVGPHLREVFKDPSKRKVMHGADRDILWLQRDFGIYVCNLFDTGQASRVMQLERKSLEYLLHRFCGINANKEYQNSDWRLRPLPDEMLKYAREDTHYLLHIYDLMKSMLLSAPLPDGNRGTLLVEVCKRSNEICMQLYDKELLTDFSFLHIYGLQEANFNLQQLSIVSALYKWRDDVARREDESTGFILPNKILLEMAREMPAFSSKLRHLVKIKSPCVDRNLQYVITIIRSSIENVSEIEHLVELFKKGQQEKKYEQQNEAVCYRSVSLPQVEDPVVSTISQTSVFHGSDNSRVFKGTEQITASLNTKDSCAKTADRAQFSCQFAELGKCWEQKRLQPLPLPEFGRFFKPSNTLKTSNEEMMENGSIKYSKSAIKYSKSAKPDIVHKTGNPSSNKMFDCNEGSTIEQDKAGIKIPQCKYSTSVPFHSYGSQRPLEPSPDGCINHSYQEAASLRYEREKSCIAGIPATDGGMKFREQIPCHPENSCLKRLRSRVDTSGPVSPTDLSSSFWNCIQLTSEGRRSESTQSKPFRESQEGRTVDDVEVRTSGGSREVCVREGSLSSPGHVKERAGELQQSLWQQAFPPPGNRSMGR